MEEVHELSDPPPLEEQEADLPDAQPPSHALTKFLTKKTLLIGVILSIILIGGMGSFFLPARTTKQKITTSPTPTIQPSATPTPIYPTSYPAITGSKKSTPTPSSIKTNPTTTTTSTNTTSTSQSPTNTPIPPSPTPTPLPTTGTISGGYYDAATHTPLTDSQFAVAAQSDLSYARSDDKPTWSLKDLKPGHYHVTINVDFSKYNQHSVTCTNCSISSVQFGGFEVDLKAGDNLQIVWSFDPK